MNMCANYNELEVYASSVPTLCLTYTLHCQSKAQEKVDLCARRIEGANMLEKILVTRYGDGTCLPRTLSLYAYCDESKFVKMRMCILLEIGKEKQMTSTSTMSKHTANLTYQLSMHTTSIYTFLEQN